MKKSKIFISPMQDAVFKSLWTKGGPDTKEYLNRIISYVVGFDIKDYNITSNELPITSENSIANKVDILLESKDKLHKINIELNPINQKTTDNKNISYLFKIAGEFYSGKGEDKYNEEIHVEQVNLNGFFYDRKDISRTDFELYDKANNLVNKCIKIHNIFLPRMKELCYDNNEIYLDCAMFMCTSFKEMEKYIRGNKERKSVMETLQNFVLNKDLPTYDYGEYLECLHREVSRDARAEGLAKGIAEGIAKGRAEGRVEGRAEGLAEGLAEGIEEGHTAGLEEGLVKGEERGKIDSALKMINSGMSVEEVSKILELDINKIKSLIEK